VLGFFSFLLATRIEAYKVDRDLKPALAILVSIVALDYKEYRVAGAYKGPAILIVIKLGRAERLFRIERKRKEAKVKRAKQVLSRVEIEVIIIVDRVRQFRVKSYLYSRVNALARQNYYYNK
jgi:hypothetical protein